MTSTLSEQHDTNPYWDDDGDPLGILFNAVMCTCLFHKLPSCSWAPAVPSPFQVTVLACAPDPSFCCPRVPTFMILSSLFHRWLWAPSSCLVQACPRQCFLFQAAQVWVMVIIMRMSISNFWADHIARPASSSKETSDTSQELCTLLPQDVNFSLWVYWSYLILAECFWFLVLQCFLFLLQAKWYTTRHVHFLYGYQLTFSLGWTRVCALPGVATSFHFHCDEFVHFFVLEHVKECVPHKLLVLTVLWQRFIPIYFFAFSLRCSCRHRVLHRVVLPFAKRKWKRPRMNWCGSATSTIV